MKIVFQDDKDKAEFIKFNNIAYPQRLKFNETLTDFRYFNELHNGTANQNILAFDENGEIIGQALYHPASYYFDEKLIGAEWGFDLFVRPDKRSESIGIHLFEYIKANKGLPIFASGVGEKALKIEKFFGYHVIGQLKKYVKINNPLFFISGLIRKNNIANSQYPNIVNVKNGYFEKVNFDSIFDVNTPYNNELLEFARDKTFIKWRFYSPCFNYVVYKHVSNQNKTEAPVYFVVRSIKVKAITSLVLVDYRFNVNDMSAFENILQATKKIANKLFLPVIITGSSHYKLNKMLESKSFKATGKDRAIICNVKDYKSLKEKINRIDFVFLTLADSDGEYLW